jgi:hypothetical protein
MKGGFDAQQSHFLARRALCAEMRAGARGHVFRGTTTANGTKVLPTYSPHRLWALFSAAYTAPQTPFIRLTMSQSTKMLLRSSRLLLWIAILSFLFVPCLPYSHSFSLNKRALVSLLFQRSPAQQRPPTRSPLLLQTHNKDDDAASFMASGRRNEQEEEEVEDKETSVWRSLDEAGQALKPKAAKAASRATACTESRGKKILFLAQSCLLYTLFLLYRAYRGFFVILPAVFRETFRKLETAVDEPFDDGDSSSSERKQESNDDLLSTPEKGRVLIRTRVTVAFLASIVTAMYVFEGAFRVGYRWIRTLLESSGDVVRSFAAAVQQQEENESQITKLTKRDSVNGRDDPVDGEGSSSARLLP